MRRRQNGKAEEFQFVKKTSRIAQDDKELKNRSLGANRGLCYTAQTRAAN